jgi:hypothetical protein
VFEPCCWLIWLSVGVHLALALCLSLSSPCSWSVRQPGRNTLSLNLLTSAACCLKQIGCRFWDLALREHSQYSKVPHNAHYYTHCHTFSYQVLLGLCMQGERVSPARATYTSNSLLLQTGAYDEPLNSFFRNTDTRSTLTTTH